MDEEELSGLNGQGNNFSERQRQEMDALAGKDALSNINS
jgi:hypothetical protein